MTKNENRAMQAWPLLLSAARDRKSYTYGELERFTGLGRHCWSEPLRLILEYCTKNKCPPLTILVVSIKTGMHMEGAMKEARQEVDINNVNEIREQVFQKDWSKIKPLYFE